MNDYSNSNWPFTFYFNGHELPKWSAQWQLCTLGDVLNGFDDDWDEFIGYRNIWHLQCRLDHVGVIESEDPLILRVCAQEVLLKLLNHRDEVLASIKVSEPTESSPAEILDGITEGIGRMISISEQDGFAVWTSGYEADQEQLKDCVSGLHSAADRPDAFELPHLSQRRSELNLRSRFQVKDLRALTQNGTLDKRLRTIVNQIPNRTEQNGDLKPDHAPS